MTRVNTDIPDKNLRSSGLIQCTLIARFLAQISADLTQMAADFSVA
jgi:hypothetical protein